jgi:hypothetical protein
MTSDSAQIERRAAQRFDLQLPLVLHTNQGGKEGPGLTQDVSAKGVLLYTDVSLSEGETVELTLVMPSEITLGGNMRVRCRGLVLRVTPPTIGTMHGVAVHFENYDFLPETEEQTPRASALHDQADEDEGLAISSHIFHLRNAMPF